MLSADEEDDPKLDKLMDDYIAQALSLVLYLCANNADVRESKRSKRRISGGGSVTEWDVGVRYGNAIRAIPQKKAKAIRVITLENGHTGERDIFSTTGQGQRASQKSGN